MSTPSTLAIYKAKFLTYQERLTYVVLLEEELVDGLGVVYYPTALAVLGGTNDDNQRVKRVLLGLRKKGMIEGVVGMFSYPYEV